MKNLAERKICGYLPQIFRSMPDLPQPILGEVTALTITSPDLEDSLRFYQKLGFNEVMRSDWPFPLIQISDGQLLIMLRQDEQPYIALTYYVRDIDTVVADLEAKGIGFSYKPKDTDKIRRYIFQSPDGLNVSLVNVTEGFSQPPGPTMLTMNPQDYFNPEKYVNQTAGMFGEFTHPVYDLEASLAFWEKLGFKALSKNTAPYPWAIASDGLAVVGMHQTKNFSGPAIAFFAADMKDKIERLKPEGITGTEQGSPSNVILKTPEGQQVFLFKLGM